MPLRRLSLAVLVCAGSTAFAIVGGACLPSSPPPPTLSTGSYALVSAQGQVPPQVTFTDAGGRRVRVIADTLQINTATHGYVERGSVAITPVGGTEQAPTPIALGAQTYTVTGATTFQLPVTIAGPAQGSVLATTAIDLRMTDASHWNFQIR